MTMMYATAPQAPVQRSKFHWMFGLAFVAGLYLLFADVGPHKSSSMLYNALWDFGHVVWTAVVVALALRLPQIRRFGANRLWLLTPVAAFVFAGVVELIQAHIGRSPSWGDVFADVAGALMGLMLVMPSEGVRHRSFVVLRCVLAIAAFLYTCLPVAKAVNISLHQSAEFPVLADFETARDRQRWTGRVIKLTREHASHGEQALYIELRKQDVFPGASFIEFPHDWTGYSKLSFSVYAEKDMHVAVRLDDGFYLDMPTDKFEDRVNIRLQAKKGWNDYTLDFDEWTMTKSGRRLDVSDVRNFFIFTTHDYGAKWMIVDNIRLEK
ncbi:VanZ family protein [Hahella sp. CR1]|uniref:VanZ family protein n=1 Tax=Hahella sp. CR1 TaxID=2992807 RepID=UPI002442437C|nr:VanZ family protein [Hahella sp. CR1]MDG9668786.1 VanZ family protein [Hahella sp. CR1]